MIFSVPCSLENQRPPFALAKGGPVCERLAMTLVIRTHHTSRPASESRVPTPIPLHWTSIVAFALLACAQLSFAQRVPEFQRTLAVTPAEPVTLDVDVPVGEVHVSYGSDGEVSIAVSAKADKAGIADRVSPAPLNIEQSGNQIVIRSPHTSDGEERISLLYRIDVPYRTKLTSKLHIGKQSITGLLGPVDAATDKGDIKAAYISKEVEAHIGVGNLDLQVIGGHVEAVVGEGNITCTRLPQGVSAETADGDITLAVVGPSTAIVKNGTGRIDIGGARDTLVGATKMGDIHVKAIPHREWQLSSASGTIRVELPLSAGFDLEASTGTGELQFDRDDMTRVDANIREFHHAINGGGERITLHTDSGRIAVQ